MRTLKKEYIRTITNTFSTKVLEGAKRMQIEITKPKHDSIPASDEDLQTAISKTREGVQHGWVFLKRYTYNKHMRLKKMNHAQLQSYLQDLERIGL